MNKKRTLQNNLSYALKYMFDNYGIKIFLDPQKFTVTLSNLIPKLDEEIKLVEFALKKNAVAAIVNGYNKREVDKNFAYLRAKTILTKNGISEKTAIYIVDCFSYALSWIDELPDYESLSDEDFKIAKKTEDEPKLTKEPKKDVPLKKNDNCELKSKPTIKLTKKNASDVEKNEDKITKKIEPLYFEEKSLSSKKKEIVQNEVIENTVIKEDKKIEEKEDDDKMGKKDVKPEVKSNSKYYLNHDFDDDEYDDDYDYDDDDEYESSSIFKKIALILIPILILGVLGFFIFKNYSKEAEPVLSGVSITTEYKIENGNYVLPISQETNLNVIIQSKNSKKIDTSKLGFKIENPSICTLKNDGKKCTITGLKEGNTNLVVIYNNEIVDSISLYFKDFVEPEIVAEPDDTQEQIDIEEETNTQEESVETQEETPTETYKNNTNNDIDNSNNNSSNNNNNENNSNNNSNNNNNSNKPKPEEPSEEEQKPEEPEKPSEEEQKPEEPEKPSEEEQKPENPSTENTDSNSENLDVE